MDNCIHINYFHNLHSISHYIMKHLILNYYLSKGLLSNVIHIIFIYNYKINILGHEQTHNLLTISVIIHIVKHIIF